jgi:hypothetical protein
MTSTKDREAIPGFWKDWFTRIGVGIWVAIFIGHFINYLLVIIGVVHPRKVVTAQDRMDFMNLAMVYGIIPGVIGLSLVLIGAVRTLRRKKIFP